MAATALIPFESSASPLELSTYYRSLPIPWRNPQEVDSAQLVGYISELERACNQNPHSPGLYTCLGMAYAMNYQVYQSMTALETACNLDPCHFYARFKYAELLYRLRALPRAECETTLAISLASNLSELTAARRQLTEIRRLTREGTQKPEWSKSLKTPALATIALFVVLSVVFIIFK